MAYRTGLVGVLFVCMAAGAALALEDPVNGKRLAGQWCSQCHLVTQDQTQAVPAAPTFMSIAKRREAELEQLETFLADPHPIMPNMSLSRQEITDLVAYIRSFKP